MPGAAAYVDVIQASVRLPTSLESVTRERIRATPAPDHPGQTVKPFGRPVVGPLALPEGNSQGVVCTRIRMSLSIRKGTSQSRDPVHAARELFDAIHQPDIRFAVFYCAPDFDLIALAAELHQRFGDIPMIGCTSAGEITPEGY